jgi:hypothetical protein
MFKHYLQEEYKDIVILFFIYTLRIWVRVIATIIFFIFTRKLAKDLVVVGEDVMFLYAREIDDK